ncbi:type II secretion system minor pseudopilin GspI [Pseudomonas huanghezhanensis]|uniref:type II secretion system minor pseudopilin GspI n=1 Tax=Pseudomonas huanghezhanensis TaxID=3002903 RepID=UPI002285B65F|nr:type II secretion system minor pseudopilin GspI [Pseudomonas sp. BSw22131]
MRKLPVVARAQAGFTLIEVLVALAIVAIALAAVARASAVMTQNSGMLHDRALALLAAQSRLGELRLQGSLASGQAQVACDEGRLRLRCHQLVSPSPLPGVLRVQVVVSAALQPDWPLAQLETLVEQRPLASASAVAGH